MSVSRVSLAGRSETLATVIVTGNVVSGSAVTGGTTTAIARAVLTGQAGALGAAAGGVSSGAPPGETKRASAVAGV